jgi:hypothetical protein
MAKTPKRGRAERALKAVVSVLPKPRGRRVSGPEAVARLAAATMPPYIAPERKDNTLDLLGSYHNKSLIREGYGRRI